MLALDVTLLLMILICIVYCWILNQRIRDLNSSRVEFARMIKEFDNAIVKAERSISDLSVISKNATEQVKRATENADEILEELRTVYEIGEKTSSKLEARITEARKYEQLIGDKLSSKSKKTHSKQKARDPIIEDTYNNANKENIDDINIPQHQNLLEKVLSKITTHKHKGTLDQASYYDSLRKLSIRK